MDKSVALDRSLLFASSKQIRSAAETMTISCKARSRFQFAKIPIVMTSRTLMLAPEDTQEANLPVFEWSSEWRPGSLAVKPLHRQRAVGGRSGQLIKQINRSTGEWRTLVQKFEHVGAIK